MYVLILHFKLSDLVRNLLYFYLHEGGRKGAYVTRENLEENWITLQYRYTCFFYVLLLLLFNFFFKS